MRFTMLNKETQKMEFVAPDADKEKYLFLPGPVLRDMARRGECPPEGFISQKAWIPLAEYYNSE
jgi:hypothetical protein